MIRIGNLRLPSRACLILSLLALTACGGGGGGSSRQVNDPPASPPGETPAGTVAGASVKGVISGARVEIREVLAAGLTDPLVVTETDEHGDYEAEIPADYAGGPLKITLTAVDGTTMRCDVPQGCGDAAFGDDVALAEGFTLSAVVAGLDGNNVSVHVTPITDLAARRAEADPDGFDAAAVIAANDVVRQTFGLPNDITAVRPVDITNPAAVAAASLDSQRIAALSAGILHAVQSTTAVAGGAARFEDAMTAFAESYASQRGLVLNDTDASEGEIVSLDDILSGASAVVAKVQELGEAAGVNVRLNALVADIDLRILNLPDVKSDDPDTSIEPLDTAVAAAQERAKALVADIRNLATSAQLEDAAEQFATSVELAFQEQMDLVSGVVTNDLGTVAESVLLAVEAMVLARDAALANPELASHAATVGDPEDGSLEVTVAISNAELDGEDALAFSVDQDINGVAVAIRAVSSLTESESAQPNAYESGLQGSLALSGKAANDEFSLVITEGSQAKVALRVTETNSPDAYTSVFSLTDAALSLKVIVTALQSADVVTFEGEIGFAIKGAEISEEESGEQTGDVATFILKEALTFESASLKLRGAFSNAIGQGVEALVAVNLDNAGGYTLETEEITQYFLMTGGYVVSETSTEETDASFIDATVSVGLIAALPGIDDNVELLLNAERTGVKDADVGLEVRFAGKVIAVSGDLGEGRLTITNQDDVEIVLSETDAGDIAGTITVGGAKVGSVEETDKGVVIIRYADGTFETFV